MRIAVLVLVFAALGDAQCVRAEHLLGEVR